MKQRHGKGHPGMEEKLKERHQRKRNLGGGGVPSFQSQRQEETLLPARRVSEKRKKGERLPRK